MLAYIFRISLTAILIVFCTLVVFKARSSPITPPINHPTANKFELSAQRAIHALTSGKIAAFRQMISKKGVLVVRREKDDTQTGKIVKEDVPAPTRDDESIAHTYLYLNSLRPIVWKETQILFAGKEKDPYNDNYDVEGKEFKKIFNQFQQLSKDSQKFFPLSVISSTNLREPWCYGFLGPAVEGKLASNSVWHMYFINEGTDWKVWKLECSVR